MGLYDRQESIQLKNLDMPMCICGCGGVGHWVAKFAAMSGVKTLYLFDPDILEEHNLNRLDLPYRWLGKNKAQATKASIVEIREDIKILAFPFIMQDGTLPQDTQFIIDCTDKFDAQLKHQGIAEARRIKYLKAGYNGTHVSINDSVAEWGEAPDGYTIIPSWVVPSVVVASMTVAKVLKYNRLELSSDLERMFINQ